MSTSTYRRPPARTAVLGLGPGIGIGSGAFPGGPGTYIGAPASQVASSGLPGIDVGAAISHAITSLEASAQVLLGLVLLGAGMVLLVSGTAAGQAIGGGTVSGVKSAARFIPVVGGLIR